MEFIKKEYNVQVLERAIKTIEALSKHPSGIELRFLADELALNKTTVFRILATLLPYDYVRQDPYTGKYRLGYKFIGLSNTVMQNIDIHEVAMPFLDELSRLTGEVVHLVIADHDMGIYIAKVDKSSGSVKMVSNIGSHFSLRPILAGAKQTLRCSARTARADLSDSPACGRIKIRVA
ncbi:MAG TPA: helix-turn-helix domain-containing protein [Clostridia bacterium]|nr:helix-turn-helix domain-containing protein [Clostridia bacterium]